MLIGRSAERERIDALLRSACDGRGGGLVVRGEAGIGKTSLLDYACERAEGMRILRARGVETEAQIPFSGLYDLLRPALSFAEEIPPRQAAALKGAFGIDDEPPVESRLLIGAGTLSLLATAAETQPVLCVIDDAHWLDVASADTLAFAVRRMDEDSVAVLFTTLDEEAFEPAGISQLVLAPLELDEAVELLHAAGIPRQVAEELYAKATGNPLALLELQEALAEPERTGQEPLPEPLRLPEKIKTAFARRILELPDETRLALAVAAADSSGELTLIARACTALGTDAAALEPAEDAGLVTLADARVHFRHPLIRAAAWGSISEREQRSVHGGLAAALETPATSDDSLRHAWHLAAATNGPDPDAARALESAALSAYARSGYRSAAAMFERAATKTEPGPLRAERLYLAAVMYFYAHSIKRALDLLAEAQANAGDDQARTRYTILHLALSYYADARTAAAALVGEARRLADVDPKHAAFAAGFAACFRAHLRGEEGALEAAELARELARGVTEDAALFATVAAGTGFVAAGCPGEAIGLRDAATEIFRAREWRYDEPAEWARGYAGVYAAYALLVLGEHGVLRERVAALAAEFVPGDEVSLMLALVIAGTAEFFAGHWSEAQAAIGRSLHLAGEINWRGPQVLESRRVLEHIAASQGAPVSTAAKRDAPIEWASLIAAGSGGLLLLGRGDYAEAAQHYETQVLTDVGPLVLYYDVADAIEAYIRAGRREEAADWLDRFSAQARESGWPWALALTAHLEALAAAAPDDEARFLTALEWAERAAQPFLQARTQLAYGDRLRRAGRRREARDLLRAALATFERLDARPWADQAAAQLRATGERVQMSQPPDVAQLTPQELQVALVVARGATNKEAAAHLFLSPKTIEKHLGGVYSKLGVRGRADLVRVFPAVEAQAPAVTEPA